MNEPGIGMFIVTEDTPKGYCYLVNITEEQAKQVKDLLGKGGVQNLEIMAELYILPTPTGKTKDDYPRNIKYGASTP